MYKSIRTSAYWSVGLIGLKASLLLHGVTDASQHEHLYRQKDERSSVEY